LGETVLVGETVGMVALVHLRTLVVLRVRVAREVTVGQCILEVSLGKATETFRVHRAEEERLLRSDQMVEREALEELEEQQLLREEGMAREVLVELEVSPAQFLPVVLLVITPQH